jgi:chaperonin GroEL
VSAYMVTNTDKMEAVVENPAVLLVDKKISSIKEILPLLELLMQAGKKELVIICEDMTGEALTTLVLNKLRGIFTAIVVKAPGYGDRRKEMLQDMAVLTGGTVISEEIGLKLENTGIEHLGSATRIIVEKDETIVVGGKGDDSAITERVQQLKAAIESEKSDFDKEKLNERLGKLTGKIAIIKVGAATETEQKEKQHRVEDAVQATKAAVAEGIVSGGGLALLIAAHELESAIDAMENKEGTVDRDFLTGMQLVMRALEEPARQIAFNAGKEGSVIVEEIRRQNFKLGYNAADHTYVDMFEAGIVDPKMVTRSALQNASSIASIMLTTEALVADLPEEKKDMPAGMPGGMGMM